MFGKGSDQAVSIQINTLLFFLEGFLLFWMVDYITSRRLGGEIRFSWLVSLLVVGVWMVLSLSGFLYVSTASLLGFAASDTWPWLKYTFVLFIVFLLTSRYLAFLPWRVAAASALIASTLWFLSLCFGKALGGVK